MTLLEEELGCQITCTLTVHQGMSEEEPWDLSSILMLSIYGAAFVIPYFRKVYVECFTEEGAALRKKQIAEKKARKESKKLRKESAKLSVEIGKGKR